MAHVFIVFQAVVLALVFVKPAEQTRLAILIIAQLRLRLQVERNLTFGFVVEEQAVPPA